MGFYGNTNSLTRSSFQIDRIYPNKYFMELSMEEDNIYLGRYVLVDYDQEIKLDGTAPAGLSDAARTIIQSNKSNYQKNQELDNLGNGSLINDYDSTVWQKVYTPSGMGYVMIAELNGINNWAFEGDEDGYITGSIVVRQNGQVKERFVDIKLTDKFDDIVKNLKALENFKGSDGSYNIANLASQITDVDNRLTTLTSQVNDIKSYIGSVDENFSVDSSGKLSFSDNFLTRVSGWESSLQALSKKTGITIVTHS